MDKKSYCAKCKQEVSNDIKEHDCGCRIFLYGSIKPDEEKGFVCSECGNAMMKFASHLDCTDKAVTTYTCTKCGAAIGKEYFRDAEDMAYWGE